MSADTYYCAGCGCYREQVRPGCTVCQFFKDRFDRDTLLHGLSCFLAWVYAEAVARVLARGHVASDWARCGLDLPFDVSFPPDDGDRALGMRAALSAGLLRLEYPR